MIESNAEFIVVGVVEGQRLTVIGRCGDRPIRVGDTFDLVYRNKKRRYPDELGDEPIREVEKPASLRVTCIRALDRSFEVMGQGMTGSLCLEGDGGQYIAPGWILGHRGRPQSSDHHAKSANHVS